MILPFGLSPVEAKIVLDALTLVAGVSAFLAGLFQYHRAQTWKRHEFVAGEIRQFNQDPLSRNAMLMLDWGSRRIELFPEMTDPKTRFVNVDRPMLRTALMTHDKIGRRYTDVEAAIRDCFDAFFNHLGRFHQFCQASLVKPEQFRPYLQYWLDTIGKEIDPDVRERLREYLAFYRFEGAQRLLVLFGVDVQPAVPVLQDPALRLKALDLQESSGAAEKADSSSSQSG